VHCAHSGSMGIGKDTGENAARKLLRCYMSKRSGYLTASCLYLFCNSKNLGSQPEYAHIPILGDFTTGSSISSPHSCPSTHDSQRKLSQPPRISFAGFPHSSQKNSSISFRARLSTTSLTIPRLSEMHFKSSSVVVPKSYPEPFSQQTTLYFMVGRSMFRSSI